MRLFFVSLIACFLSFSAYAATEEAPLPVDQAFAFSTKLSANQVLIHFDIAPNYYLYRDKLKVTVTPRLTTHIVYPQGEFQYDPNRGRYEAYAGRIDIPLTLPAKITNFDMQVNYQGCSHGGFCYPPMSRDFTINTLAQTITENTSLDFLPPTPKPSLNLHTLLSDQNSVQDLFDTTHMGITLLIFFALGVLLAFTPCVLPMVPILMSLIAGQKKPTTTLHAFYLSLTYVLAMAVTYALAGMLVAYLGGSVQVWLQKPAVIIGTSILFILLALSMFDLYELRLPSRLQNYLANVSGHQKGGTFLGVFSMGVLSTLIVSPCVTAPLVGVLMYISHAGDVMFGGAALFVMSLGMGLPLILIGASAGKLLPKSGGWMTLVKNGLGVLMIVMAGWMIMRAHIFQGNTNTLLPGSRFVTVTSSAELKTEITKAQQAGLPILIDFYADWCESCVVMEKQVFDHETVQTALKDFVLIRADLSNNSSDEQLLMRQYQVIAPPTVLLFNSTGKELTDKRIVGEVGQNEFLSRINQFVSRGCTEQTTC